MTMPMPVPKDAGARAARLALAVVASLALAGCTTTQSGDEGEARPILVTLELDATTMGAGSWVNATVTVENRGDEPYTYQHPGCPPNVVVVTAAGAGEQVQLYTYGEEPSFSTCAVREATLPAGGSIESTVMWNGHVERAQPDPHGGERVAPGEYTITAELARADQGATFADQETVTVTA